MLWISAGIALHHEYVTDEAVAVKSTGNLARLFEETTRRTIGQVDHILLGARAFRAIRGERFDLNEWFRGHALPHRMAASIGMADATGRVFLDTLPVPPGVSIVDRPHFRALAESARDALFIGKPVPGRISDECSILFTRKLTGPRGAFAGIVFVSLRCGELSRLYQTLAPGSGFVALLSDDGAIMARGSLSPDIAAKPAFDAAAFRRLPPCDSGVVRFYGRYGGRADRHFPPAAGLPADRHGRAGRQRDLRAVLVAAHARG